MPWNGRDTVLSSDYATPVLSVRRNALEVEGSVVEGLTRPTHDQKVP